jgi:hypothetical protein
MIFQQSAHIAAECQTVPPYQRNALVESHPLHWDSEAKEGVNGDVIK